MTDRRIQDLIHFGRRLADRWPGVYNARREADMIIRYEIERYLGAELSPIYECISCSSEQNPIEWTADAGDDEAVIIQSGRCPYCNDPISMRLGI